LEEQKPNISNLKDLNFILPQEHPHYDSLIKYIRRFDDSINNDGNAQKCEIHYDKAKHPNSYHSDLILALIYNHDIDTQIYKLKNYKKARISVIGLKKHWKN
jgi:hypothetical protein